MSLVKRQAQPHTQPTQPSKRPRLEVQQTLYVRNLNDKTSRSVLKQTLYLLFSTYGEVFDINMKMRGQAHVVLESEDAAARARRALQLVPLFGKKLVIEFAKNKTKSIQAAEQALAEE